MDTAVGLVKSYLELSGYFVLAELPIRRAHDGGYHDVTDLDILAVRFPHPPITLPQRISRPLDVLLGADPALDMLDDGVDVIVGEVKEGVARLNRGLRRAETVAFALRRVGCCPEERVRQAAETIARVGHGQMALPGGLRCRVRLVAFGGHGADVPAGVLVVSLARCDTFISQRLREARDVLAGAQLKDPILGLYALQDKVADDVLAETNT
jgi:hypothetical protein